MRLTVQSQGFVAQYHDDDGSGQGMVHVYKDGVDLGLGTFSAQPYASVGDEGWNDPSFDDDVPEHVIVELERLILAELAKSRVYKIQYQSTVCVYADHEIRASSPEEAAVIAAQWINGNVSALSWTDVDGDAIGGEVERGEIPFSVYEGGEEGAPLGDDVDLLRRAEEKGIAAP
jgi:hypothetical protein